MSIAQTTAAALAGAAIFEFLRVPTGSLIGAVVAVAILNLGGSEGAAELPSSVQFLSYAAMGWLIGQGVTPETLTSLKRGAVPLLVMVGVLIVAGAFVAFVVVRLGLLDGRTAFLAASPGGISQMTALGSSLGADTPLVAAVHVVRILAVLVVAPIVAPLIARGPVP